MRYPVKSFLFFLFLMGGLLGPEALAVPRLRLEPPASKITTGQSAVLQIQLEWPAAEGPYEINSLEPKTENLTLEDQNQSQETGVLTSQTFRFDFRPIKPGTAVIYPFEVSYRKSETEPWVPILVPEHRIKVVSAFPMTALLICLGIGVGCVAIIIVGYELRRYMRAREDAKNVPPPDSKQHVYAKAEESISTFFSTNPKDKLNHWSNQLRIVIATYYDIPPATHATNTEVLSFLKSRGLSAGEWNEISRLFGELTEMQFSRQDIPAHELDRIQKTLLQYVKGKIIIGAL